MNEDLKLVIKDVEKRMKQAINVAREELSRVRTGRASPALVNPGTKMLFLSLRKPSGNQT